MGLMLVNPGALYAILPTFTGAPAISGTALTGNILTLTDIGTSDADSDPVTLSYQCFSNSLPTNGAKEVSYTLTIAEAHKSILSEVTVDEHNNGTTKVTIVAAILANGAPCISGTPVFLKIGSYSFSPTG